MTHSDPTFLPESVYKHFIAITQHPHPSANQNDVKGNEDPVREYVNAQAQDIPKVTVVHYKKDATEPGKRVIVLRRPGSESHAEKTPVILQAHMDMVYNPVDMEFPLDVIVHPDPPGEGKWIKAREKNGKPSTLGADDGIGVATALAILQDENLKHYPLECLFTVQEETDMGGAQNFDLSCLNGRQLLNLDAEDLDIIIYGAAGGCSTQYQGNIDIVSTPDGYSTLQLSVSGLQGGHSGVDINKGRLNAIKVLVQALVRLNKRMTALDSSDEGIGVYDLLLSDIKRCDVDKANAIPAEAEAIIALPRDQADPFTQDFIAFCDAFKDQSQPAESGFTYKADQVDSIAQVMDIKSTDALLCMLQQVPHGVIAMIPGVPGVVETSTNLYSVDVAIDKGCVTIGSSNRSSHDASLIALNNVQANIGHLFQYNVDANIDNYPSWQPNSASSLLNVAKTVYGNLYGNDRYNATVIHAGLECGTISARYGAKGISMDCVSIGPTIKNPHTPHESLQTAAADGTQTVKAFYDAVSGILHKVFDG